MHETTALYQSKKVAFILINLSTRKLCAKSDFENLELGNTPNIAFEFQEFGSINKIYKLVYCSVSQQG